MVDDLEVLNACFSCSLLSMDCKLVKWATESWFITNAIYNLTESHNNFADFSTNSEEKKKDYWS